jgi:hypothetical protein
LDRVPDFNEASIETIGLIRVLPLSSTVHAEASAAIPETRMTALVMKNAIFLMFMVIFLLSQGVHRPTHTLRRPGRKRCAATRVARIELAYRGSLRGEPIKRKTYKPSRGRAL